MKKHYPWLWFDADNTLFDYNRAETVALLKSFGSLELDFNERYMDKYLDINQKLWHSLERQEIKADVLRVRRFQLLLEGINMTGAMRAEQLSLHMNC